MKFTVFAAFLFSIGWMSVAGTGEGRPVPCCLTVSNTGPKFENIVDYYIQDSALCPIRAVRFQTMKNKVICSDPNGNWAKRAMQIVDERRTTKPSPKPTTCYTSKTNMIPTTATTDKTSGTKTETSRSTTVTPAVTTIRTSETETSRSTTVTPAVTTIRTSETETSTSTTVTPAVTTIRTSETETSRSTTVTPAVTTIRTSETETSTSKTVPTTCGTGEPEPTTATTTTTTTTTTTRVTKTTKKLSKMMIRKKGKSKKLLKRIQMRIPLNNTTRHLNKT